MKLPRLVTDPIDTESEQYKEYLKTTDNPSWMGYQDWCGEQFNKSINDGLQNHCKRNEEFLNEINQAANFIWLCTYMKERIPSFTRRRGINDEYFEATLRINGTYNSLMMYLSNDELDKEAVKRFMQSVEKFKPIIEKGEPS